MRRAVELFLFLGLAVSLHLAIWPYEEEAGLQAAGDGGEALLSIAAANASVAQIVEAWDTPPAEVPAPQEPINTPVIEAQPVPEMPSLSDTPPIRQVPVQMQRMDIPAAAPDSLQSNAPRTMAVPDMPKVATAPPLPLAQSAKPARPLSAPPPLARDIKPEAPKPTVPSKPQTEAKPDPKAKTVSKASAAVSAKRAAGSGGTQAAGTSGKAEQATLSRKKRASLMAKWGSSIRSKIARKVPRGSGKGTAHVHITVSASGALISVKLGQSSGNSKIDTIALDAVRRTGRFPSAPKGLGKKQMTFNLPISSR